MEMQFARAVDPVFCEVLDLLDRIAVEHESLVAQDERRKIRAKLQRAEAELGASPQWPLAKYALVAWIDEVLIGAPWKGKEWWVANSLEWELFKSHEAFETFYAKAKEASTLGNKDALEVFYVCVVLNFRGMYRDAAGCQRAIQMQLSPDLETWAKQTSLSLGVGAGGPPLPAAGDPGPPAYPLDGKYQLVGALLVTLLLAVVVATLSVLLVTRDSS